MVNVPHPFYPILSVLRESLEEWWGLFDAIEYNFFYPRGMDFNRRSERIALKCHIPLVDSSDLHQLLQPEQTHSLIHAEKNVNSGIAAIKNGELQLVTHPMEPALLMSWIRLIAAGRFKHAFRNSRHLTHWWSVLALYTPSTASFNPRRHLL